MNLDSFFIPFLLFFGLILVSRTLLDRANKKLTVEQKALLVDGFSKMRTWHSALLLLFGLAFFLALRFNLTEHTTIMAIYFLFLLAFVVFNLLRTHRILRGYDFPTSYIQTYLVASTIRIFGLILFVVYTF